MVILYVSRIGAKVHLSYKTENPIPKASSRVMRCVHLVCGHIYRVCVYIYPARKNRELQNDGVPLQSNVHRRPVCLSLPLLKLHLT